jgi:hypothetical protein
LTKLKTGDRYKKKEEWDKVFDERKGKRLKMEVASNKRYVVTSCDNLIKELKYLQCFNKNAKKNVYRNVFECNKKLVVWLKAHKDWK